MTCWHEYVANSGFTIQQLSHRALLPQPDEEDYEDLFALVELYFQQALELLNTTDKLVLQCLNMPDPIKR